VSELVEGRGADTSGWFLTYPDISEYTRDMQGFGFAVWPGRRRRFKRGMLKYVVLKLLQAQERHGYDLMRHFSEQGWGRLAASSLYPVLAALEEHGYVEGREEDGKRTYRITEKGRQRLRDVADDLESELDDDESEQQPNSGLRDALTRVSSAVSQAAHGAKSETTEQIIDILNKARKEIYTLLANE
jgi:DNA-binding PadR family transcriptional regulator